MTATCKQCKVSFSHSSEDQRFYQLFNVPAPQTCPQCRMHRRWLERNSKTLYYRKCDATGEQIISQYPSETPFPVYQTKAWWSDDWDAIDFGQDYDFTRPFFEQFMELQRKVPRVSLWIIPTLENSDFTNCTGYLKNCYLIMESDYDEDCYYSNLLKHCKNVCDSSICYECELCYECIDCVKCYNLKFSQDCKSVQDSWFMNNCHNCRDCIGCINQQHKQYMILNQQYSEAEYKKIKAGLRLDSRTGLALVQRQAQELFLTQPHKALQGESKENSLGDHLFNAKDAYYCFDCKDIQDSRYCAKVSLQVKSCMDYCSWGDKAELVYQCSSSGDNAYNIKFCTTCTTNIRDLEYCDLCTQSQDLFGCVGLKKKQYCILNKQYSKEEYIVLKGLIIEHMKKNGEYGEFFPTANSPFCHNETLAQDFFPLTKDEALAQGFKWRDENPNNGYQGPSIVIPDTIAEIPEDITKQVLSCTECHKNYRLIAQEIKFYETLNIPAPAICFNCRHKRRITARNPFQIWERNCTNCQQLIPTTYNPERKEKVVCEECYMKAVY